MALTRKGQKYKCSIQIKVLTDKIARSNALIKFNIKSN